MDCSTPGLPVHHQLPEFTQTHVHQAGDAIQPSHPLSSPSPPAFNLSQHQGLFQWVSSLHHVAKVLEFQLQHQSFQWIFRTDFLWGMLLLSIPCEVSEVKVAQSCPTLCDPLNYTAHGILQARILEWYSLTTGNHSLLQGIFPTQRSNPALLHCRWIFYQLSHQGSH